MTGKPILWETAHTVASHKKYGWIARDANGTFVYARDIEVHEYNERWAMQQVNKILQAEANE